VAQRFNYLFGQGHDLFVLPQAEVEADVELLPGLDGRKMSKSYDNIVPLFEGGAKGLRDAIARIVTDSKLPGEPKEPEGTALVAIFDAFANVDERAAFRAELRAGLAWGEAKHKLVEQIERHVGPMRAHYEDLMAHPERIEDILQSGAQKARAVAKPFLESLRRAVGLRPMLAVPAVVSARGVSHAGSYAVATGTVVDSIPTFKQYRESDGRFHFKLVAADGTLLLQSEGFADGREAGGWVKRLKTEGSAALPLAPVQHGEGVDGATLAAALAALVAAQDA
jgi:tryptophanyl-tRNA synthetase